MKTRATKESRLSVLRRQLWRTRPTTHRRLETEVFLQPFLTPRKAQKPHVPLLPGLREETLRSLQKALRCQICELSMKTHPCISVLAYESEERRGENNKCGKFLV